MMSMEKLMYFLLFYFIDDYYQIFTLHFALNESQKNFTNMIPHLKRNKIVIIGFTFSFSYEYTKDDETQNALGNIFLSFKCLLTCLEACGIVKTFVVLE